MPAAPIPENEARRLKAVATHDLEPFETDGWAHEIAHVASGLTGCPIAFISIIDADQQLFRGCIGLDLPGTRREHAICAYTILTERGLIVPDASLDPRFSDNPLVIGPPNIRFYAGVPVFDESKHALGSLCVCDIHPRSMPQEQFEALARLSRLISMQLSTSKRHRAMLSASLDAIITIDRHSRVIEFNQAAERIFGYHRTEAIGRSLTQLIIPPQLRNAHLQGMRHYMKTGEGPVLERRIEITAMRNGGEIFPVELTISPITIAQEPYFTAYIRDISEEQRRERELRLTRFTVDNARDIVMWVAPDASLIYANKAAREQLGYTQDELISMSVFDIDPLLPQDRWQQHWDELRRRGSFLLESTHRRKNGSGFPVEVSCNFIEYEGSEFNCVVARDITDRKEAEERLASALEQSRRASEAKSTFLTHMSHELRTPLTAVLGFTRILLEKHDHKTEQRAILEKIDQNGRSLLSIINTILDLSKIEHGHTSIKREKTDFASVIVASVSAVAPAAEEKSLVFSVNIGENVPISFEGDAVRLSQIITNLLGNAVKYTDQGRVDLTIEKTNRDEHRPLIIRVSDTGRGIPPDMRERIFEAFERVPSAVDRSGTGLGLAIVARLAQLLDATIQIDSEVHRGSVFTVKLPLVAPSEASMIPGEFELDRHLAQGRQNGQARSRIDGLRILLVEDSDHIRDVVTYFLSEAGAHVTSCANGKECIDTATGSHDIIDLILMDMQLPLIDGYSATTKLRQLGWNKPIIALTAHGLEHERTKCLNAGCDEYISKPVEPETLIEVCGRVCTHIQSDTNTTARPPAANTDTFAILHERFRVHLEMEMRDFQMPDALEHHDDIRRRVHKLAGAAANLGFPLITKAAQACERTLRDEQDGIAHRHALDQLVDAIGASLSCEGA